MRKAFDLELMQLRNELLQMGKMVEKSIENSIKSLLKKDMELAKKVINEDETINEFYIHMEQKCFSLIALQQPTASDLRQIGSILKVVTDLERMADHAVSIAKVSIRLEKQAYAKELKDITKMAETIQKMIQESLEGFVTLEKDKWFEIAKKDELVDHLYKEVYRDLTKIMEEKKEYIVQGTQLLFVAHHLERIGDHITNLAEWFLYWTTGKIVNLNH